MKNKIYYFTGSGNSLYIAKMIQKDMDDTELISIASLLKSNDEVMVEGDRIGFIHPVYFARLPVIIQKFIEKIQVGNVNYMYSVIDGGGLFGEVQKQLNRKIVEKGHQLDAGFLVKMPSNHPKIAQLQKKEKDVILSEADTIIKSIVSTVKSRMEKKIHVTPPVIGALLSRYAFRAPYDQSLHGELDKVFELDNKCDACGLCIKCCPVGNITMEHGIIKWNHHCVNCARCYHICPQEAIQFRDSQMNRYINPGVDIEELIQK